MDQKILCLIKLFWEYMLGGDDGVLDHSNYIIIFFVVFKKCKILSKTFFVPNEEIKYMTLPTELQ